MSLISSDKTGMTFGLFRVPASFLVALILLFSQLASASEGRLACLKDALKNLQREIPAFEPSSDFAPRLGVEVEGSIDKKLGHTGLRQEIEKTLLKRYPDLLLTYRGESIGYLRKGLYYEWTVTKDVSILPRDGNVGAEFTSPILRSQEDVSTFLYVMDSLRAYGFKSEPLSSGVHVHVDFPEPQGRELAALHELFVVIQEDLLKAFHQAEPRKEFAAPRKSEEYLKMGKADEVASHIPRERSERYKTLNYLSLIELGTVEFRLFNSTVDRDAIELMMKFSHSLVRAVRVQDPRLLAYIRYTPEHAVNLRGLADALGIPLGASEHILKKIAQDLKEAIERAPPKKDPSGGSGAAVAMLIAAMSYPSLQLDGSDSESAESR